MKIQKIMSLENNVSEKTSAKLSLETLSTSRDYYYSYQKDTFHEISSFPMRNVCPSELRETSPISSHITASIDFTPCSSHPSDSALSHVSEVTFETKTFKKMYMLYQEISSKLDVLIMNQCRLHRHFLPNERRIVRPTDLPALPLTTEEELEKLKNIYRKMITQEQLFIT